MSCVLRVLGDYFDPEACLSDLSLVPFEIFHKGDPKYPASQPNGPRLESSGFLLEVSPNDGDHVPLQVEAAIRFLQSHRADIAAVVRCAEVESAYLDFMWCFPDSSCGQYNAFPAELLGLCSEVGLSIVISVYHGCDTEEPRES